MPETGRPCGRKSSHWRAPSGRDKERGHAGGLAPTSPVATSPRKPAPRRHATPRMGVTAARGARAWAIPSPTSLLHSHLIALTARAALLSGPPTPHALSFCRYTPFPSVPTAIFQPRLFPSHSMTCGDARPLRRQPSPSWRLEGPGLFRRKRLTPAFSRCNREGVHEKCS